MSFSMRNPGETGETGEGPFHGIHTKGRNYSGGSIRAESCHVLLKQLRMFCLVLLARGELISDLLKMSRTSWPLHALHSLHPLRSLHPLHPWTSIYPRCPQPIASCIWLGPVSLDGTGTAAWLGCLAGLSVTSDHTVKSLKTSRFFSRLSQSFSIVPTSTATCHAVGPRRQLSSTARSQPRPASHRRVQVHVVDLKAVGEGLQFLVPESPRKPSEALESPWKPSEAALGSSSRKQPSIARHATETARWGHTGILK